MNKIKETLLQYKSSGSNKVYNVYLIEVSKEEYLVNFEYGKFAGTLKEGTKTSSAVSLEKAEKVYKTLVLSKTKKEYKIISGFDPEKGEMKKMREEISTEAYNSLLIERLKRVGEIENKKLKHVDKYQVSRLIYRASSLNIEEAKEIILGIYAMNTEEDNVFYYSIAWALGRYKDSRTKEVLLSLRDKLEEGSKYIVQEALFLIDNTTVPTNLDFPEGFNRCNSKEMIQKNASLSQTISHTFARYQTMGYWYEGKKKKLKKELMDSLKIADEVYLKLYIESVVSQEKHALFLEMIPNLPMNQLNFSLFRRIYKVAEMREDYAVVGRLNTLLESKKISCGQFWIQEDDKWQAKNNIGCSKMYFKKRAFRMVEDMAKHNEKAYLEMAQSVLISVNNYKNEFYKWSVYYYDSNWNYKHKSYDAFSNHILFMYILYGAGQRYMLPAHKKQWEITNKNIKDEYRIEMHKEIWDKNPSVAVEILLESEVTQVQLFAFNIIKEHQDVIESLPLDSLLKCLTLTHQEAVKFFFDILKKRYEETKKEEIVRGFILSGNKEIVAYGLDVLTQQMSVFYMPYFVSEAMDSLDKGNFNRFLSLLKLLKDRKTIAKEVFEKLLEKSLPLDAIYIERIVALLTLLHNDITLKEIEMLMYKEELCEYHLIAGKLIRSDAFTHFEIPLWIKEKIASFKHPEMTATTLYLLGKLSNEELIEAYTMLVSFLYTPEAVVAKEASKIITHLSKSNKTYSKTLLTEIVEYAFKSASDDTVSIVVKTVKKLNLAFKTFDTDTLYRLLIAKSKLAQSIGEILLKAKSAEEFSVVQWARLAKNPNKSTRQWAFDAYKKYPLLVEKSMPKSLMIFDTLWEDTRLFACEYFRDFKALNSDDVVVIADSNYEDVQKFAKDLINNNKFDKEILLEKLSQHPAVTIQNFVTDLMLTGLNDKELLGMERFFNTLLHRVNTNRVAKTRVLLLLKSRVASSNEIAQMVARLASHHSASMVWADKTIFIEMMSELMGVYDALEMPLEEVAIKEVNYGV